MKFGEKLKLLLGRKAAKELAKELGRNPTTVSRWINKGVDPQLADAQFIAKTYGVPLSWLADDSQDWPPPQEIGTLERLLVSAWRRLDEGQQVDALSKIRTMAAASVTPPSTAPSSLASTLTQAIQVAEDICRQSPPDKGQKPAARLRKASGG